MGNTKQKSILHYVFKYAGTYKVRYFISIAFALLGVCFSMIPFMLMGKLVENLVKGNRDFQYYKSLAIAMAVMWVLRVICHTVSTDISHMATFKVLANVRKALCDKLSRMPLGTVLDTPSGAMKNIIVERVDSMETTLAHMVPEFTSNLTAPIVMFIYIWILDWRMALLCLATIPVGIISMALMFKDHETPFRRTQESTKALNDTAVEYIGGIEVIKAFGKAESSYERFVLAAKENANSFIDWMKSCIVPHSIGMTVTPSILLAVLPIGALFTMNGTLELSQFISVLVLAFGLVTPFMTVMSYNDDISKAAAIFGEIDDVMEQKELNRPEKGVTPPDSFDIELKNVRFGYKDKEVLHGIDLKIPAASMTALVGPSGSGKSTVARLIASLWDTDEGSILIGGVNIKDMSLESYNKLVAYVSQDNFLFDMSIRENIRMGRRDATDSEVEQIAKDSGCYDFIMGLENGFDTVVGGSGAHLSGGERQRIAIARAMMKDAPIVILDEATAYTDPENEAVIQNSVAKLVNGKTLIVIAHRLSTIVDADNIVVIKDGNIEEMGTHDKLLAKNGLYSRMWEVHISARDTDSNEENAKGGAA